LGLLVLGVGLLAIAQPEVDFARFYPYEEARALAQTHDRVLLLYFRSLHCPYCEQMETFVLGDPEVVSVLSRCFVVGMVTRESAEGPAHFRAHRVAGTPAFVWLMPTEESFLELGRAYGSMPKAVFLERLSWFCEGGRDGS